MKDSGWMWLIGGGALVYFLMPEKIKEVTGGIVGGGGGLGTVIREVTERVVGGGSGGSIIPQYLTDPVGAIKDAVGGATEGVVEKATGVISESGKGIIDKGKSLVENITEPFVDIFPEDVIPKPPETQVTSPAPGDEGAPVDFTTLGDRMIELGQRTAGVLGRQYVGAAITGTHLVKPLPFAKAVEKTFPKLLPKVATKASTKIGVKVATRAIPVVGWASLFADIGADVARLFGADVTEWLGISSLAEPFLGYNPLEKWVGGYEERKVEASLPIEKQMAFQEAATGEPEAPTVYTAERTPVVSDRVTAPPQVSSKASPARAGGVWKGGQYYGYFVH